MGIKGLFTFIKPTGQFLNISQEKNLRIGVDISYFIYRWGTDSPSKYIEFVNKLKQNKNRVLFVFDGKPSKYKEPEIETRRVAFAKATNYINSLSNSLRDDILTQEQKTVINKVIRCEKKKAIRPTKEQRQALKRIFYEQKINMLKSTEEADELLVSLQLNNEIDVIISGDTDLIRLGAQRLWVPTDDIGEQFIELGLDRVLKKLNMSEQQFQEVCVLTGGVPHIVVQRHVDIRKAWSWIRVYGSIRSLVEKHPGYWPYDSMKELTQKLNSLVQPKFLTDWVREDEVDRLNAWRKGETAPYTY